MTQDCKELLFKDLSARLPCGVRIKRETITGSYAKIEFTLSLETFNHLKIGIQEDRYSIMPYLRPMSSMTNNETREFLVMGNDDIGDYMLMIRKQDWLNAHHFDYRGLIKKGLALEAPEGMYKF